MPRWQTGRLVKAPVFTTRNWFGLLGPGLLLGGGAIGGGEWLMGPAVTAKYGGALMWLATLSIMSQVLYNIEISRYTLYTGEPIFTGKFRTLPGPRFWLIAYIFLDFGAVFPYLAANAATPLAAVLLGGVLPDPLNNDAHWWLLKILGYVIFLAALIPLLIGGKIYNSLRAVMTFKIVAVLGFLSILGIFHSSLSTWGEIFSGFLKFGSVPVGGTETENIFVSLLDKGTMPEIDFSTISLLAAFAAIAGSGGLSNAPISNYTRDQGWGMGRHVGAIPSVIGGHNLSLSHVGMVFEVTRSSLGRFRRWYRHVARDQLAVWMPACFLGLALPSMLSVQFLPRGTEASSWVAAGMTASGVRDHVGAAWGLDAGVLFWYLTMFCGFLVLAPTMATSAGRSDPPLGGRVLDLQRTPAEAGARPDPDRLFQGAGRLCRVRSHHALFGAAAGTLEVRHQHLQLRFGRELLPHAGRQRHPVAPGTSPRLAHANRNVSWPDPSSPCWPSSRP